MNDDLVQRIEGAGCFSCGYPPRGRSLVGKDYDGFIHGEIFGGIASISESIHLWNPPPEVKESHLFTPGAGRSRTIRASDFPESLLLHEYLNMANRERGSIAFHVKKGRWAELVSIIAKSDSLGVPASKSAVVAAHSPSSWKWARQTADTGDFAVMVGRQTGPHEVDVFMQSREAVRFLNDCILLRKAASRYSSFWPTEPYDEIQDVS